MVEFQHANFAKKTNNLCNCFVFGLAQPFCFQQDKFLGVMKSAIKLGIDTVDQHQPALTASTLDQQPHVTFYVISSSGIRTWVLE